MKRASRKSIVAACEQSLRRLQTDYIDLYWMHAWDRFTPIDETMRALAVERYHAFEQDLGPALTRFAVAETLSHLERLVVLGRSDAPVVCVPHLEPSAIQRLADRHLEGLHVLDGKNIHISWGYYFRAGVVLTLPVLLVTLAALALRLG